MLRAPAEVDALGATPHLVASDDRTLRAGSRVKGESGAAVEVTVFYEHVVRNPPDDPVAVKVAHRNIANGDAIRFVQANGAIVERTTVEHFVVGLVAIDADVLDDDIGDVGALKKREIGGDLGVALKVETLLQAAIEFETIARTGDQRSLNDVRALAVGIL